MHQPDTAPNRLRLSIVIPVFNEADNVARLSAKLDVALSAVSGPKEILFVDDGSTDATWQQIEEICAQNHQVKGIKLSRNFGHQHALLAGLSMARGEAIVTMDGDLQHPPDLVPRMLEAWEQGFKVVLTERRSERRLPLLKRLTSKYFYKLFSALSGVPMGAGSSDFRLLDRSALEPLLRFNDAGVFLRGAVQWIGFPRHTLPYEVGERHSGKSKYSLVKMLTLAKNAIVSFSEKPLRWSVWLGLLTSLLAFIEIVYTVTQYARGETIAGWASTIGIVALLFGILFLILGVIGTYIASIHQMLQNRPQFIIDRMLNTGDWRDP